MRGVEGLQHRRTLGPDEPGEGQEVADDHSGLGWVRQGHPEGARLLAADGGEGPSNGFAVLFSPIESMGRSLQVPPGPVEVVLGCDELSLGRGQGGQLPLARARRDSTGSRPCGTHSATRALAELTATWAACRADPACCTALFALPTASCACCSALSACWASSTAPATVGAKDPTRFMASASRAVCVCKAPCHWRQPSPAGPVQRPTEMASLTPCSRARLSPTEVQAAPRVVP